MFKWIGAGLLGAGLCTGGAAAILWINGKESVARAESDKAQSIEAAAAAAEKRARSEAATAASQASAKAAEERIANEKRLLAQAAAEKARSEAEKAQSDAVRAQAEREKAAEDRARAEAESKAAADSRAAAAAAKEAARLERDKAKSLAEAEAAKAKSAADALEREKTRSEKTIAEAKLLELRRLDLAGYERDLIEFKRELDEREAALRPEKTIKDLATYGSGADGSKKDDQAKAALPEDDLSLPFESRALFRARREAAQAEDFMANHIRSNSIARLERLFKRALEESRIVDADFLYRELKLMYPDWKYEKGAPEGGAENKEKGK